MKKINIVFIINTPTAYQVDFFNELKNIANIHIFFLSKKYHNYNFDIKKFKYFSILQDDLKSKDKIVNFIKKNNTDFVILGGYKIFEIKFIRNINTNIKILMWLERFNNDEILKSIIRYIYLKIHLKKIDAVLAVGHEAKKYYKNFISKVFYFPYSININKFRILRKKERIANFLFIGQFIERKGINLIIKSFKKIIDKSKLCNFNLTFVGNGPLKEKITNFSKKYKNVHVYPFQNFNKLKKILKKNNVLLVPSLYDGWAVVGAEAMASSMSLVISDKCGFARNYKNNIKGFVIRNNMHSLVRAINYYINNNAIVLEHGKSNFKFAKNSQFNTKNSSKALIQNLKKI